MTTLGLRLATSMWGTDAVPAYGGVVATVELVGETKAAPYRRTVTIPVGFDIDLDPATVDVPVGRYLVRAFLPSGDVVSQEVQVDGPIEISLEGEHGPHEWLSWQHLLGNVVGEPTYYRQHTLGLDPHPHVMTLDTPVAPLNAPGNGDVWDLLGGLVEDRSRLVSAQLSSSVSALSPTVGDDRVQLFRLTTDGPPRPSQPALAESRRFLLVDDVQGRLRLVSLPFPWRNAGASHEVEAEVLVQRGGPSTTSTVAVSIRDPLVGTVLGYLSSGAYTSAQEIIGPARQMLLAKAENPLAAAAGGYVLVATATELVASWHQWVDNLANWFPWLPDGPIIRARLRLQLANDDHDVEVARESLRAAFHRGLPYYGLGLQWLVDGLTVFAEQDKEMGSMLKAVRGVAQRCNLQQPFTVLDLTQR